MASPGGKGAGSGGAQTTGSMVVVATIFSSSVTVPLVEQAAWVKRPERLIGLGALPSLLEGSLVELCMCERTSERSTAAAAEFFSDHPDPGNRYEYVSAEAATLPARTYRGNSTEFAQVKQTVGGMKPYTAQEIAQQQKEHRVGEGTAGSEAAGTVAPSATMKDLEHTAFRISYPENWKVYGDEDSTVTIAPPDGISENAISYGAMISVYRPEKPGDGLDTNTHELLASLKQSNPNLREIGQRARGNDDPSWMHGKMAGEFQDGFGFIEDCLVGRRRIRCA